MQYHENKWLDLPLKAKEHIPEEINEACAWNYKRNIISFNTTLCCGDFFSPYCLREIESGLVFRISRGDAEPFWASIRPASSVSSILPPPCQEHCSAQETLSSVNCN